MNVLKECPFCGGQAVLAKNGKSVYCCGCKITVFPDFAYDPQTRYGEAETAKEWNRRNEKE